MTTKVTPRVTDSKIGGYYRMLVYTTTGANTWTIVEECY